MLYLCRVACNLEIKKEQTTDKYYYMEKPEKYCAMWKSQTQKSMYCDSIYMVFLKIHIYRDRKQISGYLRVAVGINSKQAQGKLYGEMF